MEAIQSEVVIVGAGPAGCFASFQLSKLSVPHVLIDKEKFPRDKICGDALSGKVLDAFQEVLPEFNQEIAKQSQIFKPSPGIRFVGPNGKHVDIPCPDRKDGLVAGYVAKRQEFDRLMIDFINPRFCTFYQGITELQFVADNEISFSVGHLKYGVKSKLVIGADGARSKTAEHFVGRITDKQHHSAAIRAYYSGVEGFTDNFIELHFLKDLLPGYLWVFPLPNGEANVGLGMRSDEIAKNKVNLRARLEDVLKNHPEFKSRFANATLVDSVKGWGLPLGSKKRVIAGNGFMLTGDAAWLIDPFTGEGIGNACMSGMVAAKYARKALEANDFTSATLGDYQTEIYDKLWPELQMSYRLQRLSSIKWLFNFLINKATSNAKLRETMTAMFANVELRGKLKNPLFYLSLLK